MQLKKLLIGVTLLMVFFTGCTEYSRILKSTDVDEKYEYAKMYYSQGKYTRSATLLTDVVPIYRGTEKAEDALYLLAMSYFKLRDYVSSSEYFQRYCNSFPRGSKVQECRFNQAYGDYKESPDARLDQATTRRRTSPALLYRSRSEAESCVSCIRKCIPKEAPSSRAI